MSDADDYIDFFKKESRAITKERDAALARVARLTEALQRIADFVVPDGLASWDEAWSHLEEMERIAREVLAEGKK